MKWMIYSQLSNPLLMHWNVPHEPEWRQLWLGGPFQTLGNLALQCHQCSSWVFSCQGWLSTAQPGMTWGHVHSLEKQIIFIQFDMILKAYFNNNYTSFKLKSFSFHYLPNASFHSPYVADSLIGFTVCWPLLAFGNLTT